MTPLTKNIVRLTSLISREKRVLVILTADEHIEFKRKGERKLIDRVSLSGMLAVASAGLPAKDCTTSTPEKRGALTRDEIKSKLSVAEIDYETKTNILKAVDELFSEERYVETGEHAEDFFGESGEGPERETRRRRRRRPRN